MTENEKRAHDIATASINVIIPALLNGTSIKGFTSDNIDIYAIYKKAYDASLENLNRDFHENH